MQATTQRLEAEAPNEQPLALPDGLSLNDLRSACKGDAAAFARLVRAYYPRCLRFARHVVGNAADAEECVQDTFVRVHRALHRYEERLRFNSWLFRILANRCRTARARIRVRLAGNTAFARERRPQASAVEDFEIRDTLADALSALPDEQREAFLLRHVEGFPYEHIAAVTGVAVTAARMRVSRAGARLREAVAP